MAFHIVQIPRIIAELGINWNGDFKMLEDLSDSALRHGADFVKIQMRTPDICVPKDQWDKKRLWFDGVTELSYIDYKYRMELTKEQLVKFYEGGFYGFRPWFSSVWDVPSFFRYWSIKSRLGGRQLGGRQGETIMVKIPSAKITDLDLLRCVAIEKNEILISTGMSTEEEIVLAIETIYKTRKRNNIPLELVVMGCNSSYPTDDQEVNLLSLLTLKHLSEMLKIPFSLGFSSHSPSPYPAIYSTFFDVRYIEVHYTLDRTLPGTDQAASLESHGLELLARESKRIPKLLGDGTLQVFESEKGPRAKLRG